MENKSSKGISIAALVCGIVGCASTFFSSSSWVFPVIGLVVGIVGIVLGVKGKKAAAANNEPAGLATAGMILGIVGTALAAVGIICAVACYATLNAVSNELASAGFTVNP